MPVPTRLLRLLRCAGLFTVLVATPALARQSLPLPVPPIPPAQVPPVPVVHPPAAASGAKPPNAPAAPGTQPAPTTQEANNPNKGSVTGLPLPRFAALRSDEVNLRVGPGPRYPVEWVYKRRDLPIEIEREFDVWRLVRDEDGIRGWVHQATLVGRRSFIVTGAERIMRASPDDHARPVAELMPGVIGRIRSCKQGADWCEVQVGEYRGWLKRADFWGTLPGEAVQ